MARLIVRLLRQGDPPCCRRAACRSSWPWRWRTHLLLLRCRPPLLLAKLWKQRLPALLQPLVDNPEVWFQAMPTARWKVAALLE